MKRLFLSVTDFAIPSPLFGSIETHSGYGGLPDVGSLIHLEVQAQRQQENPAYQPEQWIARDFKRGEYTINVSGRMDGILPGNPTWIEEIKSAYQVDKLIEKLNGGLDHPYRRQLQTYGYFQWLESGAMPSLSFCVVDSRSLEQQHISAELDIAEYEAWLDRRLDKVIETEKLYETARKRRKRTAKNMAFPFAKQRPGQKELVDTIDGNMKADKKLLMLQAPTGLGKTIGVMYPMLADSLDRGNKLIYLTAKNSQHSVAEDAVTRLQDEGADVRSLTLLAKHKMCFKEEVLCDPHHCEYAKDHYTKMQKNNVSAEILKKKKLNEKSIKKIAEKYEVCPFDLQMEAAAFVDVVIGDYNYVFSPYNVRGRLTKNSLGKSSSLANLIIDEAHNLPARANDYFSAELSKNLVPDLMAAYALPAEVLGDLNELDGLLKAYFDKVREGIDGGASRSAPQVVVLSPDEFKSVHAKAQQTLASYLNSDVPLKPNDPVVGIFNAVSDFATILGALREEFFCSLEPSRSGDMLRITCCDAAFWLKEAYGDFAQVAAFSATLKPFDYYRRILGFDADKTYCDEFQSPFPKFNRKILVVPQVSTKWRDRDSSAPRIQQFIERVVALKPGNYFVFFPSFDFMEKVSGRVNIPDFDIIVQQRDMHRKDVANVIEQLRGAEKPTVVFAVQGGIFSEGVDYPGDALIGAIVVGPALPNFNFEREQLRAYYDKKFGSGFDYAYTYPAMARSIQAAGRVIRSSTDRGLIVLMDGRFLHEAYTQAMPKDWIENGPEELVSDQILEDLRDFWAKDEGIDESL